MVTTPVALAMPVSSAIAGMAIGAIVCQGPTGWKGYLPRGTAVLLACALFVWAFTEIATWPPQAADDSEGWVWARQAYAPDVFGDDEYHCVRCADAACITAWLQLSFCIME